MSHLTSIAPDSIGDGPMTEEEWLTCTDPAQMLDFLRDGGRASDRRLRLFACACCRGMWEHLEDERSRQVVEVAERLADGRATQEELTAAGALAETARAEAEEVANRAMNAMFHGDFLWYAHENAKRFATRSAVLVASDPVGESVAAVVENSINIAATQCTAQLEAAWWGWDVPAARAERDAVVSAARKLRCGVIRDVFGTLPFRPITLDPSWLAWGEGTVSEIATAIYEERAFDRMGILADALEEAGCTDPEILAHLRGHEPHVRGCWVVDLLLGKE